MFTQQTVDFLADLTHNNDRDWFNANKSRYETYVRDAALDVITELQGPLFDLSPHLKVVAKVQGGSLFRIHRDTRFGKDKTPYKTHCAMRFEHLGGSRERPGPGMYFQISADHAGVGAGIWRPPGPMLTELRQAMAADPEAWCAVRDPLLEAGWSFMGESLKRPPRGFPADHALVEDLKRKTLALTRDVSLAVALAPDAASSIASALYEAAPLLAWQCSVLGLPFEG